MSIQYPGGTVVDTTFTCTVGTRREIVDGIVAALTTAGWSTVSGGGTGDVQMQSATTPQNLQIQVRIYDPGSGNCAQVFMRNQLGTLISIMTWLLPAVGQVYRVMANKYQFFVFRPGGAVSRGFMACGVPYLPSFLVGVITGDCGWLVGNATSDTDTLGAGYAHFRIYLNNLKCSALCNANLWNHNAYSASDGTVRLCVISGTLTDIYNSAYRWHDDSLPVCDPLIAWGLASDVEEAKIRGQLWGAVVVGDNFAADSTISLDGKTWRAVTNSNVGSASQTRGTLFIATT